MKTKIRSLVLILVPKMFLGNLYTFGSSKTNMRKILFLILKLVLILILKILLISLLGNLYSFCFLRINMLRKKLKNFHRKNHRIFHRIFPMKFPMILFTWLFIYLLFLLSIIPIQSLYIFLDAYKNDDELNTIIIHCPTHPYKS